MGHDLDLDGKVQTYFKVFAGLLVLSVVTVLVSFVELSTGATIALALVIASCKAGLVAGHFMHLLSERAWILGVMALTMVLFLLVLLLPVITESNSIGIGV